MNNAFADREVKAIVCTIGGDESARILPLLNNEVITANPKILMGYSDITTLLTYCTQLGLVTFHGPTIMAGFSQLNYLPRAFADHVSDLLFDPKPTYLYESYDEYSDGYPDWTDVTNLGKVKTTKKQYRLELVAGKLLRTRGAVRRMHRGIGVR